MKKLKVGDVLYSLNVGNAARNCEQKLTPVTVTKVGRKYFTCTEEGWSRGTDYHLGDWSEKSDYAAYSCLYESPEAWENEKEFYSIVRAIRNQFDFRGDSDNYTLDQLRQVAKILNLEGL